MVPEKERSTAMGVINACGNWGAVLAPPLIAFIISMSNWRWVFFFAGTAGLVWAFWWNKSCWPATAHAELSAGERTELAELFEEREAPEKTPALPWLQLFRYPQVWGLFWGKFLSDTAW